METNSKEFQEVNVFDYEFSDIQAFDESNPVPNRLLDYYSPGELEILIDRLEKSLDRSQNILQGRKLNWTDLETLKQLEIRLYHFLYRYFPGSRNVIGQAHTMTRKTHKEVIQNHNPSESSEEV